MNISLVNDNDLNQDSSPNSTIIKVFLTDNEIKSLSTDQEKIRQKIKFSGLIINLIVKKLNTISKIDNRFNILDFNTYFTNRLAMISKISKTNISTFKTQLIHQ